jgi:DNA-directed RNA polymerase subunit RPC12/RpoP
MAAPATSPKAMFDQVCPTCGRRLQIAVDLLGRVVSCKHCRAQFTASHQSANVDEHRLIELLSRAEEFLASSRFTAPSTG